MTAERLTDLGEQMDAIRVEALRRVYVAEGHWRAYRTVGHHGRREYLTTDELVARVESHADLLLDSEMNGSKHTGALGRWCFA